MKDRYIQAAKAACAHVHEICALGSANRDNGEDHQTQFLALLALRQRKVGLDTQISNIQSDTKLSSDQKSLEIIKLLANVAENANAGNCQEMAAVAFLFLMKINVTPIELVSIPKHTFIIIGRDPGSSINDPECWGEDVVICDPWRRKYKSLDGTFFLKDSMIYSSARLLDKLKKYDSPTIEIGLAITDSSDITRVQRKYPAVNS